MELTMYKPNPTRSQKYLNFVRTLPSVVSGQSGCVPHHVIACGMGGGMGTKASDLHTFPLTPEEHNTLHNDVKAWEQCYGSQTLHVLKTQAKAEAAGVLEV